MAGQLGYQPNLHTRRIIMSLSEVPDGEEYTYVNHLPRRWTLGTAHRHMRMAHERGWVQMIDRNADGRRRRVAVRLTELGRGLLVLHGFRTAPDPPDEMHYGVAAMKMDDADRHLPY